MVLKFFACLVLEKNQSVVFACFFENTNSKSCSESRIKFLVRLSFARDAIPLTLIWDSVRI
jgi:hypothetical protein